MKKIGLIAGVSFLAGTLFFALTFGYLHKNVENETVLSPSVVHAETNLGPGFDFVSLVKKVKPAVVKVISESIVEGRRSMFGGDGFFERFFNMPQQRQRQRVSGVGSGFFISADGYLLTNYHVVKDAVKIKIIMADGKEFGAKKIGTDPKTDLALLKVKAKGLPFIELGDSSKVEVGEWVLAIGNPLNQDLTVTSGIISAKGRQLGIAEYEDFLQTDAAINRGNSGGPLVNLLGKVIGINSAILAPTGGNVGIGFAIPADMAKKVVQDLKSKGRVVRGWLGVYIQGMSKQEAKEFDLPVAGVMISKIENDSPAEKSGLERYDLIVEVNGERVKTAVDLRTKIANSSPGDTIELTVYREDKKQKIEVTVGEAPDSERFVTGGENARALNLGMVLTPNSPALARQYELKTAEGLFVRQVERGGVAHRNGIREGDVILAINRTPVDSLENFRDIISKKEPGTTFFLLVNRFGNEAYSRFTLPE
jgi:serine protease Do